MALCRFMPRSCISAKSIRLITAPLTVRNFFFAAEVSVSQAPKPECNATTACISWNKESDLPIGDRKLPPGEQRLNHPCQTEHYRNLGYAHDTPATLCMKRQTIYIIVIDISSFRLNSELWQKLLFRSSFLDLERWRR
jgi:hypothetical protein